MSNHRKFNTDLGAILAAPKYYECYANLAKDRIIFISEDVTKDTASSLSAMLLYYDEISEKEDISIYINTNGGDASALVNIIDVMGMIKSDIKTIVIGKAYSAGAFILAAGTPGKRYATRNSKIMLHGVQVALPPDAQKKSEIYINYLKSHNRQLLENLARNTKKTAEEVMKDCENDVWMEPTDAIEYGIIDAIL
jgi:ATP-dependent Clp protease protease subunit